MIIIKLPLIYEEKNIMPINIGIITKEELQQHIINTTPDFLVITNFEGTIEGWILGARKGKSVLDIKFEMKKSEFIGKDEVQEPEQTQDGFKYAKLKFDSTRKILYKNMSSFIKNMKIEIHPYLIIGKEYIESSPVRFRKGINKK